VNNTYVWSITELNCLPTAGSLTDYVVTSHWLCTGTDGTYDGSQKGIAVFTVDPTKKDYTPYQDLKEDEVIAWTQDALGADTVQLIYRTIDRQIQGQVTPAIITPELPWSSS
jgi:hypothetical protein